MGSSIEEKVRARITELKSELARESEMKLSDWKTSEIRIMRDICILNDLLLGKISLDRLGVLKNDLKDLDKWAAKVRSRVAETEADIASLERARVLLNGVL